MLRTAAAQDKPPIIKQSKSIKARENENPITEEVVKEHLESLGYRADVLDPQDLQDFIKELQNLWEKDGLKEFPHHQDHERREESMEFESVGRVNNTITSGGSKITRKVYNPNNVDDDTPGVYQDNTLLQTFGRVGDGVKGVAASSMVEENSHHQNIVTIKSGGPERGYESNSRKQHSHLDTDKQRLSEEDEAANLISSLNLNGFKKKVVEQKLKSKSASTTRSSSPAASYGADEYSFEDYSSSHVS